MVEAWRVSDCSSLDRGNLLEKDEGMSMLTERRETVQEQEQHRQQTGYRRVFIK